MRIKKHSLMIYLLFFSPRIQLLSFSGITSDLRLDTIVQFSASFFSLKSIYLYVCLLLSLVNSLLFFGFDINIVRVLAGFVLLLSMTGVSILFQSVPLPSFLYLLKLSILIQGSMHLVAVILERYIALPGFAETAYFFLKYGLFNMPFGLAYYIVIATMILLEFGSMRKYWRILLMIFVLFVLIFLENRVSLLLFSVYLVGKSGKSGVLFCTIFLVWFPDAVGDIEFFDTVRALSVVNALKLGLLSDPSIMVRLDNISRMYEYYKSLGNLEAVVSLAIGRGPFSYMEYSVQYGRPAPMDSGYVRILADYGIIGLSIFAYVLVRLFTINKWITFYVATVTLVSEAILVIKCSLLIPILFSYSRKGSLHVKKNDNSR